MTMTDLESALDDVRDADGIVDVRECEDASLVDEVEESLGVEFCRELREFHEKYEYIQIGFEEFTWIRTMGDTIAGIRSSSRDIPEHYVPILSDGRGGHYYVCLLYTSPSPRDKCRSRMPSSA